MIDTDAYSIVVVQLGDDDGGGFMGFVPDLPGCISDGETRLEALRNTEEALAEWLEVQIDRDAMIPEPGTAIAEAVDREHKLLDAIRALASYREDADEKIAGLERQLAELIAVLKDNSGRVQPSLATLRFDRSRERKLHH